MDTISISRMTCDGLDSVGIGDWFPCMRPEDVAYRVLVLKKLKDDDAVFPRGKWATIQELERQLDACAESRIAELRKDALERSTATAPICAALKETKP